MPDVLDRDALRRKYREERDKRLRPDGRKQYIEPVGRFASILDDPYTPWVERDPIEREVTVLCVGGGWSGLVTAAALKDVGIDDVLIFDRAGGYGGVWYWNRYPGAMCDTASMVYLPLLEETGYRPSMKYVFAPEIRGQALRIAEHYGLNDKGLFHTGVTGMTWDDDAARWTVTTDRGDTLRARYVTVGAGPLDRPKLPGVVGIENFQGHVFHPARWDYTYTGGSPDGEPMDRLADKRVGIIGTGATAVQCIPHLARASKEFYVFQRTPSSIDVRNNHPLTDELFDSLEPGWQREWHRNFATLQTGGFADVDYVQDGWTDISKRIRDRVFEALSSGEAGPDVMMRAYEDCDDEKMNEIRARVDSIVQDPATAEALKPWYRQLCKRPCFHDEYLDAYNLPTCHLVDTEGQGVRRADETGVWVGDTHYDLDCIVLAGGFEFGSDHTRRWGFDLVGRDGRTLADHWANGMRTMHGMNVHGFPNFFVIGMTQGANLISNISQNLTDAGRTTAAILSHARELGATRVEVTDEAEAAYVKLLQENTGFGTFLGNPDCTPGYYNNEGGEIGEKERLNVCGYPGGPVAFFDYIDAWRSAGDFKGLTFEP